LHYGRATAAGDCPGAQEEACLAKGAKGALQRLFYAKGLKLVVLFFHRLTALSVKAEEEVKFFFAGDLGE
jgi:hypothetical protein